VKVEESLGSSDGVAPIGHTERMTGMDDLRLAEKAHQEALAEYELVTARYEAAVMARDESTRRLLLQELLVAGERYAATVNALVSSRRRVAPSFEELLRDPRTQLDRDGEILESILAYSRAVPASASAVPVAPQPYEVDLPVAFARIRGLVASVSATTSPPLLPC